MSTKRPVGVAGFVPDPKPIHVPSSWGQRGVDSTIAPQPVIPKPLAAPAVGDDVVLAFPAGVVRMGQTAVTVSKNGAPTLLVQDYEGRPSRMAFDPAAPITATVTVLVLGPGAQSTHDSLIRNVAAGQVCRMYGPMVGPGKQGAVWAFAAMPEIVVPDDGMNSDGTLRKWSCTFELTAWLPMGTLNTDPSSRVSPRSSLKKAQDKGASGRFVGNAEAGDNASDLLRKFG